MIYNYWPKKNQNNNYPIVFIHGYATTSSYFDDCAKLLNEDYDYYSVELPGMGINNDLSKKLSPYSYAEQIIEWIKEMKFTKINLIGHSMGGGVVNMVAAKIPELINKLISICPMSSAFHFDLINAFSINDTDPDEIYKNSSFLYHDYEQRFPLKNSDPKLIKNLNYQLSIKKNTKKLFRKMCSLSNLIKLAKAERNIVSNALLITAANDKIINAKATNKKLLKNKHFKSYIVENSGHIPFIEKTNETYQVIKNFLD